MIRPDLLKKLEERQIELAEVFIKETDAAKWPDDQTRDNRGDRYWHKRNAGATATLIVKIQSILDVALKKALVDPAAPVPGDDEDEEAPEAMAAQATREAQAIIDRHQGRFKKK